MNLGLEYIKYRWKAKRRHGVHSPFIYDLTDKCFRIPVNDQLRSSLEALKQSYRGNNRTIEITDFGAGSKKLGNNRKIGSIYATSSSKGNYGTILHQLVGHFRPSKVLELGTSLGIGTVSMASGHSGSIITTVEGCPNTFKEAKTTFENLKFPNINAVNAQFSDFISNLTTETYDLVFIDGHHDGEALLNYMKALEPFTNDDTLFILDDIRWSNSMWEAWNSLVKNDDFHVTIDFFRMGIVTRRHVQVKEHFVIH